MSHGPVTCREFSYRYYCYDHFVDMIFYSWLLKTKIAIHFVGHKKKEISIFYQNFLQNFDFFTKIPIFDQNFDVRPEYRFLIKISIFNQHFDF